MVERVEGWNGRRKDKKVGEYILYRPTYRVWLQSLFKHCTVPGTGGSVAPCWRHWLQECGHSVATVLFVLHRPLVAAQSHERSPMRGLFTHMSARIGDLSISS